MLSIDILETKVLGSNKIYTHHWKAGDLLVLNNPSLAHLAGPGSQGSLQATGLRLMHRSTVPGTTSPTKKTNLAYVCQNHPPFHDGYCLFSLKVIYQGYFYQYANTQLIFEIKYIIKIEFF